MRRPLAAHLRSTRPRQAGLGAGLFLASLLVACGSGGGSNDGGSGRGGGASGNDWQPGVFLPADTFANQCANPRSGVDPDTGRPWPDVQGTTTDENNFLRSYSNDTYLWYDEIVDRDPALYDTPTYFELLKTEDSTASGAPKDKFHFTVPTDEWREQAQSGISAGYGAQWVILDADPPDRAIVVAYTDPNTPATNAGLVRGTEILEVDGHAVADGDAATLNAGLFPTGPMRTTDFRIRDPDGIERDITMTSEAITSDPVQNVQAISTQTGNVGYLLFNDHIATAEDQLADAVEQLANQNVTDVVIDLRYNGGGFLYIASELAYMIAGAHATGGRVFESLTFNDKHPNTNPVTGQPLSPIPFYNTYSQQSSRAGQSLPSLDLSRVFVLTGPGTCSASESVINSLRGVDVEVIQIGSTTCGKPYGFYPTDNCGTTYFTIQFRGENDKGFGDYSDGFSPQNASLQTTPLPGCQVADDFSNALGDPQESRLAAALAYRDGQGCPAPTSVTLPGVAGKTATVREEQLVLPRHPAREMRLMDRR